MADLSAAPLHQNVRWLDYISTWHGENSLRIQLASLLEELTGTYRQLKSSNGSGSTALADIISEFTLFSLNYFYYFLSEADSNPELVRTLPQDLRHVLAKIERELVSLRIPVTQRLTQQERLDQSLRISDAIGTDVLRRSTDKSAPLRPCLTTFDETNYARVNRWSYRPLPTVAIPSAQIEEPWLWLGVGHEIAHFVYNNFSITEKQPWNWYTEVRNDKTGFEYLKDHLETRLMEIESIRSSVLKVPQIKRRLIEPQALVQPLRIWHEWLEEIFADIFGVLVLGPAYSHALLLILFSSTDKEGLLLNDSDHPIAFLRPFIQVEALRQLAKYNGLEEEAFLKEEGSLLGFDRFKLPNPGEIWKTVTARLAEDDLDEFTELENVAVEKHHKDWLEQSFGELKVKDYLEMAKDVVSLITQELFSLADEGILQCYTMADHNQVRQAAKALANGATFDPGPMTPALMLTSAWYAWREITQAWISFLDDLSADLQPLANPAVRGQRLNAIRTWLKGYATLQISEREQWQQDGSFMDQMEKVIAAIRGDTPSKITTQAIQAILFATKDNVYLSESFERLLALLEAANLSPKEIREFLLAIEFSAREDLTCPPNTTKVCYCSGA